MRPNIEHPRYLTYTEDEGPVPCKFIPALIPFGITNNRLVLKDHYDQPMGFGKLANSHTDRGPNEKCPGANFLSSVSNTGGAASGITFDIRGECD